MKNSSIKPWHFLLIPLAAYVSSYAYLASYHGQALIFQTIVHEGGTHTFLETAFYASHFLGHVPVLTVYSFLFTGFWLATGGGPALQRPMIGGLFLMIAVLYLAGVYVFSMEVFGREDTLDFIMQRKQAVGRYVEGGSWLLHMPSTMLLPMSIPLYIFLARRLGGRQEALSAGAAIYIAVGAAMFFMLTLWFTPGMRASVVHVWTEPRYLAHSVREVATFPLTYFPLAIYAFMRNEPASYYGRVNPRWWALAMFFVFLLGLAYQVVVPLRVGIGELAQQPDFTAGKPLGISYLLASHYFEHIMDTVYFLLLSLALYNFAPARK